jgi:hypothetical protein
MEFDSEPFATQLAFCSFHALYAAFYIFDARELACPVRSCNACTVED